MGITEQTLLTHSIKFKVKTILQSLMDKTNNVLTKYKSLITKKLPIIDIVNKSGLLMNASRLVPQIRCWIHDYIRCFPRRVNGVNHGQHDCRDHAVVPSWWKGVELLYGHAISKDAMTCLPLWSMLLPTRLPRSRHLFGRYARHCVGIEFIERQGQILGRKA